MADKKLAKGPGSGGHIVLIDNTAKRIARAKKKKEKEDRPVFMPRRSMKTTEYLRCPYCGKLCEYNDMVLITDSINGDFVMGCAECAKERKG